MLPRMEYLRIWIKEGREWREVENGPFPITGEQLEQAREAFRLELAQAKPLHGANHAPQTAARAILKTVAPKLADFDCLMVGFAVTNQRVKWEVAKQ